MLRWELAQLGNVLRVPWGKDTMYQNSTRDHRAVGQKGPERMVVLGCPGPQFPFHMREEDHMFIRFVRFPPAQNMRMGL